LPWECSKCGNEFFYDDERIEAQEARGEIETERYSCEKCDFTLCYDCYDKSLVQKHNETKHGLTATLSD
jgi:hypothetical protein